MTMRYAGYTILITALAGAGLVACEEEQSVSEAYCAKWQQCEPSDFADEYSSVGACARETEASLAYLRQTVGPECGSAQSALYDCFAKSHCDDDIEAICAAEIDASMNLCSPEVTDPCPGYVAGSEEDYCCQIDDPCEWALDTACDCGGSCDWDSADCGG